MGKPEQSTPGPQMLKPKKYKTLSTIIIITLIVFVVFVFAIPATYWAKQIYIIIRSPKNNILVCKNNGGEWLRGGWGNWWCRYRTNDWGKVCFSKSDCTGNCLSPGREAENGFCSKYNQGSDYGVGSLGYCPFEKGSDFGCIIE
ncbi:MAG: hypothetical protein PHI63_06565 [Patescibacteria group bacterium]|nr:hypothetical protein [Patescibacteria group bacterium]